MNKSYGKLTENYNMVRQKLEAESSMMSTRITKVDIGDGLSYEWDKESKELILIGYKGSNEYYAIISIADSVADGAFKGTAIKKVSLPMCKRIGFEAFYDSDLEEIYAPICQRVEVDTFKSCQYLSTVWMPECKDNEV